jgi:hypothetical protein
MYENQMIFFFHINKQIWASHFEKLEPHLFQNLKTKTLKSDSEINRYFIQISDPERKNECLNGLLFGIFSDRENAQKVFFHFSPHFFCFILVL